MPQTITELFNNLSVAPQPTNIAPASFNGVIKSASAPQSNINVGPTAPKGVYQNFLLPGETLTQAPIGGGFRETLTPVNLGTGGQLGEIINSANPIPQQPETKLSGGDVYLASPFRNTAATRIIS